MDEKVPPPHPNAMDWFPEPPDVQERAEGESALRYEDVSQDGRVMLLALPHSIGDVIWRKIIAHHPLAKLGREGIVSVLTRMVLEAAPGPIGVGKPLRADGRFQLAHTVDARGDVDRLMLNMWCTAQAPRGRTFGPPPPGAGEPIAVGRVFAEHVLTRLFAPPAQRKVLSLGQYAGFVKVPVPEARWQWREHAAVLALPEGAAWLDDDFAADPAEVVFGLTHTDSNQHVNSLVYPRLFQEAALRRLAQKGLSAVVLAERLEIAYRKPCFAGGRARILLRAFVQGDKPGAVGAFVSEAAPLERPHCVISLRFG
jgi:hypothetical protein